MVDLAAYRDLSRSPLLSEGTDLATEAMSVEATHVSKPINTPHNPNAMSNSMSSSPLSSYNSSIEEAYANALPEMDSQFSPNVATLIRLVSDLPDGVTKQTGAQIIRLTMEAMGVSMEDVLSEAQAAQSDMLDAVRANIKKIEEFKTVIRKLESDIKFYQGKANELSEIIDLFILSNSSPNKPQGLDN